MFPLRVILWLIAISISPVYAAAGPLNINSASAQQIETHLPGIGKVKAEAIINYRNRNGPFTKAEQLLDVKGVGPQTLLKIEALVSFGNGQVQAHSIIQQNNLQQYDKAVKRAIRQIVSRAKAAGANSD